MLVQALANYADTYLGKELSEMAFEEKPVKFVIEINESGHFLGVIERTFEKTQSNGKRVKTVRLTELLLVPRTPENRNSGIHPLLTCDAIQYVVGPLIDVWSKREQLGRHSDCHSGFIKLINRAATETKDFALEACVHFYNDKAQVEKARQVLAGKKAKGTDSVVLSVRPSEICLQDPGGLVIEREAVREFWRKDFRERFNARHAAGGEGMCLISGKFGPIATTHNKIKGVAHLGGRAEVSLMSFDKPAFRSYGWEQNANSPISPERAAAYVLALNDLLRYGEHRQGLSREKLVRTRSNFDYGGLALLYWTREPTDENPMSLFEDPQPEHIKKLLNSPFSGIESLAGLRANEFYLLSVSGNGGRLVVHDWFCNSLNDVWENINRWFAGMSIADVFNGGRVAQPVGVYELLKVISPPRVKPNDKVNAERTMRLVRRALYGLPLSYSILAAALARLRLVSGVNRLVPARIGLIRLCVNDILMIKKEGGVLMAESLDPNQEHPAYICGRIFAIYESLQYQAQGKLNVNITDHYYGLASTYPQLAFPKLEILSKNHLKKLKRENGAAAYAVAGRIDELTEKMVINGAKYPEQLNIEDQGRFAIGYHHQRAEDARAREDRQRKNGI